MTSQPNSHMVPIAISWFGQLNDDFAGHDGGPAHDRIKDSSMNIFKIVARSVGGHVGISLI
jgi:hypothetical protein